jgi:hypothetical protein
MNLENPENSIQAVQAVQAPEAPVAAPKTKTKKINPRDVKYGDQATKIGNGKVRVLNEAKEAKSQKMTPETLNQLYDYVFGKTDENPFADIQEAADRATQVYDDEFTRILEEIEKEKEKRNQNHRGY